MQIAQEKTWGEAWAGGEKRRRYDNSDGGYDIRMGKREEERERREKRESEG